MPYKAFKRGSKWKVYTLDADGNPTGPAHGTFDSEEAANKQVKALYVNASPASESVGVVKVDLRTSDLHEAVDLSEAELDEANHYVRGVTLITAGWSKNNRYYPVATLEKAVPLFNGVKAYADHPTKSQEKDQPGRSIFELAGWYENVHMDGNRMKGDFFVEDERVWPKVKTSVTVKPGYVDLSINGLGDTSLGEAEGRKGVIVEAITHANSCDVVTMGAAGGGFAGSNLIMSDDGWTNAVIDNLKLRELREARPDLIDELKSEVMDVRQTDAIRALTDKVSSLEASLQASQVQVEQAQHDNRALLSELHEARVDRLLDAAKLPHEWKDSLRNDLIEAAPDEWPAILEKEQAKARAIPQRRRVTVTGAGASAPDPALNKMAEARSASRLSIPGETLPQYEERMRKLEATNQ